jgi:biopolymer transport protein ExbB
MNDFILTILNNSVYGAQAVVALWGAYCVVVVYSRVAQKRFRDEAQQNEFLDLVQTELENQNVDNALELCSGDQRAVCQLAELALQNKSLGYGKIRQLLLDRFQRDVLSDLEHRISWINTVVKTEPMLGLLGTVMGMVQAFGKLGGGDKAVDATELATDISFALYTTAIGLVIAIPLIICMSSINVRIRKMEDLVGAGLTRFFEIFRATVPHLPTASVSPPPHGK